MKKWQYLDLYGRAMILVATLFQLFWLPSFADFELHLFWYDTMENQRDIGLFLLGDLTEEGKKMLYDQLIENTATNNQFGEVHKLIKMLSFAGFGIVFLIGSGLLKYSRKLEFAEQKTTTTSRDNGMNSYQ